MHYVIYHPALSCGRKGIALQCKGGGNCALDLFKEGTLPGMLADAVAGILHLILRPIGRADDQNRTLAAPIFALGNTANEHIGPGRGSILVSAHILGRHGQVDMDVDARVCPTGAARKCCFFVVRQQSPRVSLGLGFERESQRQSEI